MEKIPLWRSLVYYSSLFFLLMTIELLFELITKKHMLLVILGEDSIMIFIYGLYFTGMFKDSWAGRLSKYLSDSIKKKVKK